MTINYKVEYFDGATYVALTNVESINIHYGRRHITDQFTPSMGTVVLRAPNLFATPISSLVVGCKIQITNVTSSQIITTLFVSDIQTTYGIPYQGSQGALDYVTISLESQFALWGRQQGNGLVVSAGTASSQLSFIATAANLTMGYTYSGPTNVQVGASVVDGTYAEWINKFLLTTGGKLYDIDQNITLQDKQNILVTGMTFSDTTNDVNNKRYYSLEFASVVDNYYTQVEVDPDGFAPTVVQSGAAPYRSIVFNTFNADAGQGADLANYYLAQLSAKTLQPVAVSCLAEAQSFNNLDSYLYGQTDASISLVFRGTSRTVKIIGGSMNITPESLDVTYYVSGFENNNFLLLDNTVFGTLDNNRLGF